MVDHRTSPSLETYTEALVQRRRHKNVTPDMARDLLVDANYFGRMYDEEINLLYSLDGYEINNYHDIYVNSPLNNMLLYN